MKITKTVIIALRNAIETPSQRPNALRVRISPPTPSGATPAMIQDQPQPVTLKMKEKGLMGGSLTGDDFSITDVNGREVCKCKGKVLSISSRKIFTDSTGRELFHLKNKRLAINKSFIGEAPDGTDLFTVRHPDWLPRGNR